MPRPKANIDPEHVKLLAGIGCPVEEIALVLGCDKSTLMRRFATIIETGRAELRKSLRRKQVEVALSGNVGMLIWLGKQLLGQSDEQRIVHAGGVTIGRDDEALEAAIRERLERERLLLGDGKQSESSPVDVLPADVPELPAG